MSTMDEQQPPTRAEFDALRQEIAELSRRVSAQELSRQLMTQQQQQQRAAARHATGSREGDAGDAFAQSLHDKLREGMAAQDSPFGLAAVNMVVQAHRGGGGGTAFSIVTMDGRTDLPTDEHIEQKIGRVAPLIADPLVLRALRQFYSLRFEGKSPRATAQELAGMLAADVSRVEEVLRPLVANQTIHRGLTPDGTPFFEFDGNNHLIATLLFRG